VNETSIHLLYKTLDMQWKRTASYHYIDISRSQVACQQIGTVHMGRCDESTFTVSQTSLGNCRQ